MKPTSLILLSIPLALSLPTPFLLLPRSEIDKPTVCATLASLSARITTPNPAFNLQDLVKVQKASQWMDREFGCAAPLAEKDRDMEKEEEKQEACALKAKTEKELRAFFTKGESLEDAGEIERDFVGLEGLIGC